MVAKNTDILTVLALFVGSLFAERSLRRGLMDRGACDVDAAPRSIEKGTDVAATSACEGGNLSVITAGTGWQPVLAVVDSKLWDSALKCEAEYTRP
eukprot:COSAG06_NODE_3926_length_4758_cov_1.993346_2_plen_96_part_00